MGEAAANLLLQGGHENKVYEIAGSESYSYHDVAEALSKISGRNITYTAADPNTFRLQLKDRGVDDFVNLVVTGFNLDIKNGQFEMITNDLEKLLGRKPTGLQKGLMEVFELAK